MSQFRFDDWSGGQTDYFLNAEPSMSEKLENLLVDRNKKPFQRAGSVIESTDFPLTGAGNTRISRLIGFRRRSGDFSYFKAIGRHLFYLTGAGQTNVLGVGGRPFFSAAPTVSHISYDDWNDHFIATVNDPAGSYAYPTLGFFPGSSATPIGVNCGFKRPTNFTATGSGTDNLYTYAIHYSYTYMVGDVEFVMRGAVELAQTTSDLMDGVQAINLTFDGFDVSSTVANFDVSNIKLRIFRSVANGSVQYFVDEVPYNTTSFLDTTADDDILDGEVVYITGGVLDYEPLPLAKFCTIVQGTGFYANIKETEASTSVLTYRLVQSFPGLPYSSNGSFFVDLDGEITGLSRFNNYPIATTYTRLYRIEGLFNSDGTGYLRAREIGTTTGCVSNDSMVRTPDGIYFAGTDGFYWTDGQTVQKISDQLDESYPQWVRSKASQLAIKGELDEVSGRIYWTVSTGLFGNECDKIVVLDPYWRGNGKACFSTLVGDETFTCTSLLFNDKIWYRSSINGYTYIHSQDSYTDPVEDVSNAAEDWHNRAVVYDWSSAAVNFGSDVERKWVTGIVSVFKNETNLSVQPWTCNDASGDWRKLKHIRYRGSLVWGQSDFIWGSPDFIWRDTGNVIAKRFMPAGVLRCTHKQVKFTNSTAVIVRSDDYAPAIFNAASKTVLLTNHPTDIWPEDVVGYAVRYEFDGYKYEYPIVSRTADTLIVFDELGNLQNGTYKWEIVGFRKGERLSIDAVTVNFEVFGSSHTAYQATDEGGNA